MYQNIGLRLFLLDSMFQIFTTDQMLETQFCR